MLIPCRFLFFVWGIFGAEIHLGCCFKGNVGTRLLTLFKTSSSLSYKFQIHVETCTNMNGLFREQHFLKTLHHMPPPPHIISYHIIHMGMCYKKHLQCTVCNLMTNLCPVPTNAILLEEQGKFTYHFYSLRTTSLQFELKHVSSIKPV